MSLRRVPRFILLITIVLAPAAFTSACRPESSRDNAMLGAQGYLAHCAACHGDTGAADGPLAEDLAATLGEAPLRLDAESRVASLGRSEVRNVIVFGGAETGRSNVMPAWGDELDADAIEAITDHVMAMARGEGGDEAQIDAYMASPAGHASDGRALYVYYCSGCHGPQGKGDGSVPEAFREKVHPRDLTDTAYLSTRSDQDLYAAIALGGRHAGESLAMPGWTYELEPDQMRTLIEYIRAISKTQRRD